MEKNIQITLDQARELYKYGFKELALQAFSKEELEMPSTKELCEFIETYSTTIQKLKEEHQIQWKLKLAALYFNDGWKRQAGYDAYFIKNNDFLNTLEPLEIGVHNNVIYPGIVYFKRKSDIYRALRILKDKNIRIFNNL